MAGGLAEEAVFGPANASIGRGDDRESATQLVLDYIRRYGFDPRFQAAYTMDGAYMLDRTITDLDAEKLIGRLVAETEALIQTHKPLVVELATRLRAAGELTTHAIAECAREYGLAAEVATEGHLHLPGYAGLLEGVAGKQSAAEPRPPKKLAGVKKKG